MRLSAHDASFLYTETASGPMHSVGLTVLDGAPSFETIFNYYAARIHLIPRLRHRLAFVPFNLAHPKWVDDADFDLANHVQRHPVPASTTLRRAIEIALELGEALLDRARPLWLTYVIENVEGKTLLVQLTHHAFADGATMVALTTVLTDAKRDAPAPEAPSPWRPTAVPSSYELWQEAVTENAQKTLSQAQQMAQGVPEMGALAVQAASLVERMTRPVMVAPWNASMVGPKRKFVTRAYPLTDMKAIRSAFGGTINDIVVTVVAEGAARYLQKKGEVVEDQLLRLMCPVNVRDESNDPLSMSGNHVSAMFPLVAAEPMQIRDRFDAVCTELAEIKQGNEPEILDRLQGLQPHVPPIGMAQALGVGTPWDPTLSAARAPLPIMPHGGGARPQQLGFNFTCTNVPGPTWTQYVAGHEVLSTVGTLMLGGNLGLGVGVNSYDGALTFAFTCDPRLVPDIEVFAAHTADALAELQQAAAQA